MRNGSLDWFLDTSSSYLVYINELVHSLALALLHPFVADIRVGEGARFVPCFKGASAFIKTSFTPLPVG